MAQLSRLADTMYLLLSVRESTAPQNRQLEISTSNSKQKVDDFLGELTFKNHSIHILCEISLHATSEPTIDLGEQKTFPGLYHESANFGK